MPKHPMSRARKKKIKTLLGRMNKQNERLILIAPPLVDMMNLTTSDRELDFLLQLGTGLFTDEQAADISNMPKAQFRSFFDTLQRKGLIHTEHYGSGAEAYRLNAIAVGWYEAMMHYLVGKPEEKLFSEKFRDYFQFFKKLSFSPLRNVQNAVLRHLLKPTQDVAIMDPATRGKNKRKTIPINTDVAVPGTRVYPTSFVNSIIEEFGNQDAIYAFPCVCRHGTSVLDESCGHKIPTESCFAFGDTAKAWASYGYGRFVSKAEATEILKEVRDKGAVHSIIHERDDHRLPVLAICNCCWDCCGILKPYNMGAVALKYKSYYAARITEEADCKGCGNCERYCPTTAISMNEKKIHLNSKKCIGCGQCAYQCRQNNIELYPNERMVYLPVLKKSEIRVSA